LKLVIQVVGYRKRGKTTLIEYLIEELKQFNLHPRIVKETKHKLEDVDKGDTLRFTKRGSPEVYLLCSDGMRVQSRKRPKLEDLVDSLEGLIIVEGGKSVKRRDWYAIVVARDEDEAMSLWKPLTIDTMYSKDSARVKAKILARKIATLCKVLSCPVASFTDQHSANSSSRS